MPIKLKKPQLKDDELKEFREWMLDVWTHLNTAGNIRGDGKRILVTQSPQGSVIRLLEDDYKKTFPFFVESQEGGPYSENKDFLISGGTVSKQDLSFEVTGIKENIDKKYLYLVIYNTGADEAAEIPEGDDATQQDIDEETEENFFAKFEQEDTKIGNAIEENKVNILIGCQVAGAWDQKHTGDVYLAGSGGGSLVYATSPNTDLDEEFTIGAVFKEPGTEEEAKKLSVGAFYLSTPWNKRVTAPTSLFAFWNKVGDNYYLPVTNFYVKFDEDYPDSGGATSFTCYYNDSSEFSLGGDSDFPEDTELVFDGFGNDNAHDDVLAFFNGKRFPATYDSENKKIYMTHPRH
jgi:hypothetical protein